MGEMQGKNAAYCLLLGHFRAARSPSAVFLAEKTLWDR
jgi:hypothetical protein